MGNPDYDIILCGEKILWKESHSALYFREETLRVCSLDEVRSGVRLSVLSKIGIGTPVCWDIVSNGLRDSVFGACGF